MGKFRGKKMKKTKNRRAREVGEDQEKWQKNAWEFPDILKKIKNLKNLKIEEPSEFMMRSKSGVELGGRKIIWKKKENVSLPIIDELRRHNDARHHQAVDIEGGEMGSRPLEEPVDVNLGEDEARGAAPRVLKDPLQVAIYGEIGSSQAVEDGGRALLLPALLLKRPVVLLDRPLEEGREEGQHPGGGGGLLAGPAQPQRRVELHLRGGRRRRRRLHRPMAGFLLWEQDDSVGAEYYYYFYFWSKKKFI